MVSKKILFSLGLALASTCFPLNASGVKKLKKLYVCSLAGSRESGSKPGKVEHLDATGALNYLNDEINRQFSAAGVNTVKVAEVKAAMEAAEGPQKEKDTARKAQGQKKDDERMKASMEKNSAGSSAEDAQMKAALAKVPASMRETLRKQMMAGRGMAASGQAESDMKKSTDATAGDAKAGGSQLGADIASKDEADADASIDDPKGGLAMGAPSKGRMPRSFDPSNPDNLSSSDKIFASKIGADGFLKIKADFLEEQPSNGESFVAISLMTTVYDGSGKMIWKGGSKDHWNVSDQAHKAGKPWIKESIKAAVKKLVEESL